MVKIMVNEDIYLRSVELTDAERIFQLTEANREYLREWLPWLDFTQNVEDSEQFIKTCIQHHAEQTGLNTVIVYKGEVVGMVSFNAINKLHRNAAIGYWLASEYQGKGLVGRAVQALIDYAFSELKLNRVEIRAAEGNSKSRMIAEKLGFKNEGHIRQAEWLYDHFVDHIVYGMLAEDWEKREV